VGKNSAFFSHRVEDKEFFDETRRGKGSEKHFAEDVMGNDLIFERFRKGHERLKIFLAAFDQKIKGEEILKPDSFHLYRKFQLNQVSLHSVY
jgi:hypothetical protein